MSKILKSGNIFTISEIESTYQKLPMGVYNLGLSQRGYYLSKANDFTLPEKIYGDLSVVDRWLTTYNEKKRNVGILLSGLKGGGKTITAKYLAIKANKPIIVINAGFSGPDFTEFITDPILGDCVIFIDEFEKVYSPNNDNDGNDSLLSLLDGPYETHHLFIFTVNQNKINSNLINRPSRILYAKLYEGLGEDDIREIVDDKLKNKEFEEEVVSTCSKIYQLSFDILISIIDEVNRFNEPASKCIKYMNLTPQQVRFDVRHWYRDLDGNIIGDVCGYSYHPEADTEGRLHLIPAYFKFYKKFVGDKTYHETSNSCYIDMDDAVKVNKRTYLIKDEKSGGVYTLTESFSSVNGYSTEYSFYRPNDVPEPIIMFFDENRNYLYHTPKNLPVETVEEITGYTLKERDINDSGMTKPEMSKADGVLSFSPKWKLEEWKPEAKCCEGDECCDNSC